MFGAGLIVLLSATLIRMLGECLIVLMYANISLIRMYRKPNITCSDFLSFFVRTNWFILFVGDENNKFVSEFHESFMILGIKTLKVHEKSHF